SGKFEHEKEMENVRQAVLRYDIQHPVIVDQEFRVWSEYAVKAWPTLVVIDPDGYVVSQVSGEGHYSWLNELIGSLVEQYSGQEKLKNESLNLILEKQKHPLTTPLAFPGKVLARKVGDRNLLFIADTGHHRIIVSDLDGNVIQIIGTGNPGFKNGSLTEAEFSSPQGMALDSDHSYLYVADTGNHGIRCVDLENGVVTAIAGTGKQNRQLSHQSGKALEIPLNSPWDLEKVGEFLYIAIAGSHQIWQLNLKTNFMKTYAGTGAEACVDGDLQEATFAQPSGISTNGKELFIADSESSSIREISLEKEPSVRTICGSGGLFGFGDQDGIAFDVRLQHCLGIESYQDSIFIADTYNHKIKRINPENGGCQAIAGQGNPGYQDGKSFTAKFYEPSGVTAINSHLYIADTNNHAIRCLHLNTFEVTTLEFSGLCAPNFCFPNQLI
ncbi:MAG: hypothetical protein ACOC04_06320, partial [Halothece sp.]